MGRNRKHLKKKTTFKSSISSHNDTDIKKIKREITFKDDSEGSGDEVYKDDYSLEDFVKTDFIDEADLFRHFFRCLKKTRHLLKLTEDLLHCNIRVVDELFDIHSNEPANDAAFEPEVPGGTNPNLINASKKICLKIPNQNGERRLIATEKLKFGDVLIIEKAIIMTDLLNSYIQRFTTYRCHHCLRFIGLFVTCPTCDIAVFCGYNCRYLSWNEYHRWECFGLQRRFWYTPDPQYIALRLMFYGAQNHFNFETKEFQNDYEVDEQHYGDEKNPYKYIYKLKVNIKERSQKELSEILLKCSELLVYLIEDTDFFTWLCKFPEYSSKRLYDVYMIIGGILVRHYIQAELHTIYVDQINGHDGLFSDKYDFQSGAIFLTASLLKHHCKPNAICSFRENYIIVKAFQEIQAGEEITLERYRMHRSKETCKCIHCIDKIKKKYENNSFVCTNCRGKVVPSIILNDSDPFPSNSFVLKQLEIELGTMKCVNCDLVHDIESFKTIDKIGQRCTNSYEKTNEIEHLEQALRMYTVILQPSHIFLANFYENLVRHHLYRGSNYFLQALPYIKSHLRILESQYGKYSYVTLTMKTKYAFRLIDFCNYFNSYHEEVVTYCVATFKDVQEVAKFYYLEHKLENYSEIMENIKTIAKNEELEKENNL